MIPTIDLDHELHRWRQEIHDEALDDHLPPKAHTQASTADGLPKPGLRQRGRSAHLTGVNIETFSLR
jgi:hypothetical protein